MARKVMGILLVLIMLVTSAVCSAEAAKRNIVENPDNPFTETIVDLGGRTIKLASAWVDTYDYWEEKDETPTEVLKNMQILKDIQEDYNCKIELVDMEGIEWWEQELVEQLALAKASGDTYADILDWQTNMNPGPVVYRDYLVAAQDIPALNDSLGAWSPATRSTEYGGKIYGFNAESPLGYIRSFLLYNKDYAKQYGIEDMYALVKDNKWTFDKFLEVSEKVYDQSGGKVSSIVTRYGMPKALLEQFMTSNDAVPFTQKDGKLVTQINTEKGIRACQFVVDMIGKKLIDMEYINNPGDPYDYFIAGNSMFYIAQGWEIGEVGEELPSDFGILPMPMGPDATSYASYYDQIRIYSIVDNGDGGEAAAHVLLALKKRQADTYLDIEDAAEPYNWLEDLAYDASDDESLEMADLINNSLSMNYIVLLSEVPGWEDAAAQIAGGVSTPAEAIGAITAQLQAAVDEANK